MNRIKRKRAQAWYGDFIVATLVFAFALVLYNSYTSNISKQNSADFNDLIKDAKDISSSLIVSGHPTNWNNKTVIRIGLTNNDQRLDKDKWINFANLDYNKSRKLLGTTNSYFVYFEDKYGNATNAEGFCGTGDPLVNVSFNIKAAYYYSQETDKFLKDFMVNAFNADVYKDGMAGSDFPDLINNINTYGLVVIEHPLLSTSVFNSYRDDLEDYASIGGFLMLSGELVSAQGKDMAGVKFYKKSGQSESDRNASVNMTDDLLAFEVGQNIVFTQAYYVADNTSDAELFKPIVRFVVDQNIAVARWNYGNGSIFFFSDFDATYFAGNFQNSLESATRKWIGGSCTPISVSNINARDFVKTERYLIYNSDILRMVLYVWK